MSINHGPLQKQRIRAIGPVKIPSFHCRRRHSQGPEPSLGNCLATFLPNLLLLQFDILRLKKLPNLLFKKSPSDVFRDPIIARLLFVWQFHCRSFLRPSHHHAMILIPLFRLYTQSITHPLPHKRTIER